MKIIGNNSSKLAAVSNQVYSQLKFSHQMTILKLTWHWHPIKNHSFIRTHIQICNLSFICFVLIYSFLFHTFFSTSRRSATKQFRCRSCAFTHIHSLAFRSCTLARFTPRRANQLPDNLPRFSSCFFFFNILFVYIVIITIFPTTTH